jgi:nucleosome binding factor SPN SPT16 subunit
VKLTDVQVRPSFDGKRQSGDVEIHTNGIRYQSSVKADQKIGSSQVHPATREGPH